MNFLWQEALWLLLLLPLLVLAYRWLMKRRKKTAVAWSSLAVVKEAMGNQRLWRRHVPPVLFLVALTLMIDDDTHGPVAPADVPALLERYP